MSRSEIPLDEAPDNIPAWSFQQWENAEEKYEQALASHQKHFFHQGPAYILFEDNVRFFHRIATLDGDIQTNSRPLKRLDLFNRHDAYKKSAYAVRSPKDVKGYSLEVHVAWGGAAANIETLHVTLKTTDPELLRQIQAETVARINELVSLSAVRDWLLQHYRSLIENITIQIAG